MKRSSRCAAKRRTPKTFFPDPEGECTHAVCARLAQLLPPRPSEIGRSGQHVPDATRYLSNPKRYIFAQVVLQEGRHRQIRRMCDLMGLKVTALKRVRIGPVMLGSLKVGCWDVVPAVLERQLWQNEGPKATVTRRP